MSTTFDDPQRDAPTDTIPPTGLAKHAARPAIPHFIRKFAVPIILVWIGIIALLNIVVPQLDEVGKMRSVSMSPDDAQSVIATKRVGEVFREYKSNSSVMIVLEGQSALGNEAHAYYDQIVKKLDADTKHVEHVQDFWSDPLTGAGAQSNDGKAAYVQVYLAGNQGEALANESVEAVQHIVGSVPAPNGIKAYVTGPAALSADQNIAGDRSLQVITTVTFLVIIAMLLLVYRSIVTVLLDAGDGGVRVRRRPRVGRLPGLPQDHRALHLRDEPVGHVGDRGRHRLRDLSDRAISGGARGRRVPRRRLLHHVWWHRTRGAGVGPDHRRSDVLPALHQPALLPDAGCPVGHRHGGRRRRGVDAWPGGDLGGHALPPAHWNPSGRSGFEAGARSARSWSGGPDPSWS